MPIDAVSAAAIRAFAFVFGALWGSFFNVAIYRWPREMSVVAPPSHCPACKAPIPPFRNVPIFGWLFLRGKASCCGAKISPRYPLVELLAAVLGLAIAERFVVQAPAGTSLVDAGIAAAAWFTFAGALLIATFVDLEWMEIPDEVSLPGAAIGLASVELRRFDALDAAVGAGVGFLVVQVLFVWTYERLLGRRGMGEGDAKLLMMIGAFVGWQGALFALVAGSLQGLVVAIGAILTGKDIGPSAPEAESTGEPDATTEGDAIAEASSDDSPPGGRLRVPFGPFLALGALEHVFFGERLLNAYFRLFE